MAQKAPRLNLLQFSLFITEFFSEKMHHTFMTILEVEIINVTFIKHSGKASGVKI
jgi:hypothetical protein